MREINVDRPKVYLAGPEVFRPDAVEVGRRKVALCERFGFEGLFPLDNEVEGPKDQLDALIYQGNVAMIREADYGIFNLTPYQGVSADVGTAFELGMFAALGKPAYGYTTDGRTILDRARQMPGTRFEDGRGWVHASGDLIEDFGNFDNLMIDGFLETGPNRFIDEASEAVGFETCLRLARLHADGQRGGSAP